MRTPTIANLACKAPAEQQRKTDETAYSLRPGEIDNMSRNLLYFRDNLNSRRAVADDSDLLPCEVEIAMKIGRMAHGPFELSDPRDGWV